MNNINDKGFTAVELIISFTLVMFIAIGMFSLVTNYRSRQQVESTKKEILTFKTKITQDIQKDIYERKVKNITSCGNKCVNINFMDGITKKISVETEEITINDSGTNFKFKTFYISYGGVKYKNPEPKFLTVTNNSILTSTTTSDDLKSGKIYKINIDLKHEELKDDFVIRIVVGLF